MKKFLYISILFLLSIMVNKSYAFTFDYQDGDPIPLDEVPIVVVVVNDPIDDFILWDLFDPGSDYDDPYEDDPYEDNPYDEDPDNNYNPIDPNAGNYQNNEVVLVGPDKPINNVAEYLNCFDKSKGAIVTIYADQPVSGEHYILSGSGGVGHAFISIQQDNSIKTLGFYPQSSIGSVIPNVGSPLPNDFYSTPGALGNDEGHTYDISLSVPINANELTSLINGFVSVQQNNLQYNIGSVNCASIAIGAFQGSTGINIPSAESPVLLWNGETPGTLGEVLRDMPTPPGGTKNSNGGNASANNCN